MLEIATQILNYLIANYALYMVVTMGVIISLTISLLTLIKKPIKKLTAKIQNEKLRKLANKMFIIFAFGISAVSWITLNLIAPSYFPIDALEVLLTGAFSIVIYAFADGVFTKSSAKTLVDKITDFAETSEKEDNKSENETEKDPIKEFWKKVK